MVLIAAVDRFRRLPIIGIGAVLIVLGYGVMPFGSGLPFICFTVVIWTLGEMLSMPLLTTWVGERAPPAQRSRYLAAVTAMFSIAWVVGPILGGALYQVNVNAIWYASLALSPIIGVAFWLVSRFDQSSSAASE